MSHARIVFCILFSAMTSVSAQVSIAVGIALPGVNIGINLPAYPQLEQVPGYPVYYAPKLNYNFFFYDGLYWVYQRNNWYVSSWYDGPWGLVDRQSVPLFVLRIPVRYYRSPPSYFHNWASDAPPRWGEHWGPSWEQQRRGWDEWNRHAVPAPAPLPSYQQQYSGSRYPSAERQQQIQSQNYHYQPREIQLHRSPQQPSVQRESAPEQRKPPGLVQERDAGRQDTQREKSPSIQQRGLATPQLQPPPHPDEAPSRQRNQEAQDRSQNPKQRESAHEQPKPKPGQDNRTPGKSAPQEENRGREQNKGPHKTNE